MIIPKDTYPAFSFFVIIILISQFTKIIITIVDEIVFNFKFSHAFIGLTIGSWGGNIGGNLFYYFLIVDVVNSSMAAKQRKTELALSAIIGS